MSTRGGPGCPSETSGAYQGPITSADGRSSLWFDAVYSPGDDLPTAAMSVSALNVRSTVLRGGEWYIGFRRWCDLREGGRDYDLIGDHRDYRSHRSRYCQEVLSEQIPTDAAPWCVRAEEFYPRDDVLCGPGWVVIGWFL